MSSTSICDITDHKAFKCLVHLELITHKGTLPSGREFFKIKIDLHFTIYFKLFFVSFCCYFASPIGSFLLLFWSFFVFITVIFSLNPLRPPLIDSVEGELCLTHSLFGHANLTSPKCLLAMLFSRRGFRLCKESLLNRQ